MVICNGNNIDSMVDESYEIVITMSDGKNK
jgi:hypothetical protein